MLISLLLLSVGTVGLGSLAVAAVSQVSRKTKDNWEYSRKEANQGI
ncbi:MAG TPA: hypothetical protein PLE44_02135 [Bacilli bacterium]|jgi:Tfp pilus assembly protein PilV|nr:hypothetical protein [Bacilli bacterium]HOC98272.1 hypothetical protein [Bacilli bacterium]HOF43376.1 hypothetical protein [Bacilli bacterium]HOH58699.1 hypothetical protein [Bacilli bacterium]HOR53081.1 hypothetical protein [Bacilli bacterium]